MARHKKEYYESLLNNANVQAYLLTIRKGEGTLGTQGYSTHFGGGTIESLDKNPSIGKKWTAGKYTSSAVGAFQFLNSLKHPTWPNIAARFGFEDFSPRNQDIGALYLIDEKNALPDIVNGNIVSAIEKTKGCVGIAARIKVWTADTKA
jgi:muramidase (phage lysozyme)